MKLRALALVGCCLPALAFAAHCGGDSVVVVPDDSGADTSQPDVNVVKDSGKDANKIVDASDSSIDDAQPDAAIDAPIDAAIDAPLPDGGISSLSGLVLWLDAAKGITKNGSSVTAWADQSSAKNDANAAKVAPAYSASAINKLPAVTFDANTQTGMLVTDSATLQWGTGDYLIEIVSDFTNDPKNGNSTGMGSFFSKVGKSSGIIFFANDYDIKSQAISAGLFAAEDQNTTLTFASAYNDGTARLYALQRVGNVVNLRVNAAQVATFTESSPVDVSATGFDIGIGVFPPQANFALLNGDIAEVVAIKGATTNNDLAALESYLKTKYAL